MSGPTVVAFNTLGGASDVGAVQAGFELLHRSGTLALGSQIVDANRPVLGWDWDYGFGDTEKNWRVFKNVDFVIANPPCSFASTLARKDLRGSDSKAAFHSRATARYIGLTKPKVAALESVQPTWTRFREFVDELHQIVNQTSGIDYELHVLLHNNAVLGGSAQRKRVWLVWSRIPFGTEPPVPKIVPVIDESIGDLMGLGDSWKAQPYRRPPTWWSENRRAPDGTVDGHKLENTSKGARMTYQIFEECGNEVWRQAENLSTTLMRIYQETGTLPGDWKNQLDKLVATNFNLGINQPKRLASLRPARVITGGALGEFIHPHEPRTLTHREAARIQGFPDTWRIWPVRNVPSQRAAWGKGVPVESAYWLSTWVMRALEGDPGTMTGEPERLLDGTRRNDVRIHQSTHANKLMALRDGRGHMKTF